MLAEQQQHQQQQQQHHEEGRSGKNTLTTDNLQRYQNESAQNDNEDEGEGEDEEYEDDMATGFGGYNPAWASRIVLLRTTGRGRGREIKVMRDEGKEKREGEREERRRAEEEWAMF